MSDLPPPPPAAAPDEDKPPGTWAGVGIGCGAHLLAVVLMLATLNLSTGSGGPLGVLWPFIIVLIASGLTMISPRYRRLGAGMLTVAAAAWIVLIGPCVLMIYSV